MERIDTTTTHCDGCGTLTECAMLGPDGHYTLALCGCCYKPLADQQRQDLISLYSDLHKDLYGMRPRGQWMVTCPLSELQEAVDRVAKTLEDCILQEEYERAFEDALENNLPLHGDGWSYTPAS